MKNLFAAIIIGIALAGATFAQASKESSKPRIAVIEFATGPKASTMTYEAKRQLQASIAFAMVKNHEFDVPDVRNTRAATTYTGNLTLTTAAAIGRKLGVGYVLIGTVDEYSTTSGRMIVKTQLVKVGTGTLVLSGTNTWQSSVPMTGNAGHAEMSAKVVKPGIQELMASIRSANL